MQGQTSRVYLDYTATEIDAQYNMRAAVPTFQTYVDEWVAHSRSARNQLSVALDLAYGSGPTDRLDVFGPSGERRRLPVQIFFHGGYWRAFSKAEFSFIASHLVPAGMIVVIIDYALCPTVTMDQLIAQCRRAVQWVGQNLSQFGGDPDRLYLSGHSAGGQIVAMIEATDWINFSDKPGPRIRGICAISGLYELEPLRYSFLQPDLRLDDGQINRNSPIRRIRGSGASLLLAVGELETLEFYRQTTDYAATCQAAGINCKTVTVRGANHYSILDTLGHESGLRQALLKQMEL
jgi:arylformamidase